MTMNVYKRKWDNYESGCFLSDSKNKILIAVADEILLANDLKKA